jgi:hypothetical protein
MRRRNPAPAQPSDIRSARAHFPASLIGRSEHLDKNEDFTTESTEATEKIGAFGANRDRPKFVVLQLFLRRLSVTSVPLW